MKNPTNEIFCSDEKANNSNPYLTGVALDGFSCLFIHLVHGQAKPSNDYPIAFGYMASLIRLNGGHAEIRVTDPTDFKISIVDDVDMLCFFPMAANLNYLLKISTQIKMNYPDTPICLFNSEQHEHEMIFNAPNAANFAHRIMNSCAAIDYILIGQSEFSFISLCSKLVSGDHNFEFLPSTAYRKDGEILMSCKPPVAADFDYLPFPARDALETVGDVGCVNSASIRVQSSRGCLSKCRYCAESRVNSINNRQGGPWIGRGVRQFVDEIESLQKKYQAFYFNIIDSSFEDPINNGIKRMFAFCDEIQSRTIEGSFKIHLRAPTIQRLDVEGYECLKNAGVDIIVCGIESGSDRELSQYSKKTNAEISKESILKIDSYGRFCTILGHMMFSPFLTVEDLSKKIDFLNRVKRGWDWLLYSNTLLVFRGTALHDDIIDRNLSQDDDPLSVIVPYRYQDEKIRCIATIIGEVKIQHPNIMNLNRLLYDAQNIKGRFTNKANNHLWDHQNIFEQYDLKLADILTEASMLYQDYFNLVIESSVSSPRSAHPGCPIPSWFEPTISSLTKRANAIINEFLDYFVNRNLKVDRLHLKTWVSTINLRNTTRGKI